MLLKYVIGDLQKKFAAFNPCRLRDLALANWAGAFLGQPPINATPKIQLVSRPNQMGGEHNRTCGRHVCKVACAFRLVPQNRSYKWNNYVKLGQHNNTQQKMRIHIG